MSNFLTKLCRKNSTPTLSKTTLQPTKRDLNKLSIFYLYVFTGLQAIVSYVIFAI